MLKRLVLAHKCQHQLHKLAPYAKGERKTTSLLVLPWLVELISIASQLAPDISRFIEFNIIIRCACSVLSRFWRHLMNHQNSGVSIPCQCSMLDKQNLCLMKKILARLCQDTGLPVVFFLCQGFNVQQSRSLTISKASTTVVLVLSKDLRVYLFFSFSHLTFTSDVSSTDLHSIQSFFMFSIRSKHHLHD